MVPLEGPSIARTKHYTFRIGSVRRALVSVLKVSGLVSVPLWTQSSTWTIGLASERRVRSVVGLVLSGIGHNFVTVQRVLFTSVGRSACAEQFEHAFLRSLWAENGPFFIGVVAALLLAPSERLF